MEAGQAVDLSRKSEVQPGGFDSFHPHQAALAQFGKRRRFQKPEVQGSSPWGGTISPT